MEFLIVFGIGLVLGLVFAFLSWMKNLGLKKEIRKLNETISMQAQAFTPAAAELEKLKEKKHNQAASIAILKQQPSQTEMSELRIICKAYRRMVAQAPGFAAAWQNAIDEAKREDDEENKGFRLVDTFSQIRQMFSGLLPSSKAKAALPDSNNTDDDNAQEK